ncbi:MAG: hypothetical protein AABW83_02465 [Nanoarchaeota archaeon]
MTNVLKVMDKLSDYYNSSRKTTLNRMREDPDPFKILIGCLVSINIKDIVCEEILDELFSRVNCFQDVIDIDILELENILYKARYRKVKAKILKSVSEEILNKFNSKVPDNESDLLSIKGIGPKTCNVVLNFAYGKDKIPVDSNTIRIVNRIGWINSDKYYEVERFLVDNLRGEKLRDANAIFMLHGRNTCVSVSPFCSNCPVKDECKRVGVERSR